MAIDLKCDVGDYILGYTLAGISARLLDRMQSVLNAAARLVYGLRKFDHVTPLLRELHWLRVPERITFRLVVLVYRSQQGNSPPNLTNELHHVADAESRYLLRSASTMALIAPSTDRSTIGDCAFPVAATPARNSLPLLVTSSLSLSIFPLSQNTKLFSHSFGLDSR